MGAINWSLENFMNSLHDVIIIKTGLVVNDSYIINLFNRTYPDQNIFKNYSKRKKEYVRIRSEEFDYYCWDIRKDLGELDKNTDPYSYGNINFDKWLKNTKEIDKFWNVFNKTLDEYAINNKNKTFDLEIFINIAYKNKLKPPELIFEVLNNIANQQHLSNTIYPVEEIKIKKGIGLNTLFKKEIIPSNSSAFFEQRFINYLEANPEYIDNIHWRNFERLVAEYFNRDNFIVNLGKGTKDGGVDLRIYDETDNEKPYIIVQCKRNKNTNKVKIETVKSFYTDLEFEGAQKGLIATTSTVTKGGKALISIRKYPLQFAENEEIKNWIRRMKKR